MVEEAVAYGDDIPSVKSLLRKAIVIPDKNDRNTKCVYVWDNSSTDGGFHVNKRKVGEIKFNSDLEKILFYPNEEGLKLIEKEEGYDSVAHPKHYMQGKFETIEEMEIIFGPEWLYHYCCCNAWKYRARAPYKGNPIEDNEKADWYLAKAQELKKRF